MTYWQEVRQQWQKSLAAGGVISYIAMMLVIATELMGGPAWLMAYSLVFICVWLPMFLILDMLYVEVMRRLDK